MYACHNQLLEADKALQLSWPYQRPVIFTSFGAFEPKSVSEGWIDSKTPAISPVAGSTCVSSNSWTSCKQEHSALQHQIGLAADLAGSIDPAHA